MTIMWSATDHAKARIVERFGVPEAGAIDWLNNRMKTAEYVTNAPDTAGKMRRVFIGKGVVFHASLTENVIFTVIRAQRRPDWSEAIRKAAEKELRKFNARAVAEERTLIMERSTLEIEILDVKAALLATRSATKKIKIQERYNELSTKLAEIERAIIDVRRSVVRMAESFSAAM